MKTPRLSKRVELLTRLYDMKQKQLLQASTQAGSLHYRVLEAEARAISEAMKLHR